MLYRKRKTPVKEYILLFLWIAAIITKIKAKTITETAEIATKITKTLAIIKYMDNQILTADLRDVAMSAKKKNCRL